MSTQPSSSGGGHVGDHGGGGGGGDDNDPHNDVKKYRGVRKTENGQRWLSQVGSKGKSYYLGTFDDPKEAAAAYDITALHLHKKSAKLNFSKELYENHRCPPQSVEPDEIKTHATTGARQVMERLALSESVEPLPLGTLVTSGNEGTSGHVDEVESDDYFQSVSAVESAIQDRDSMAIERPPLPSNDNAHTTTEVAAALFLHGESAKLNSHEELYENISPPPSLKRKFSDAETGAHEVIKRLPSESVEPSPLGTLVTSGNEGISRHVDEVESDDFPSNNFTSIELNSDFQKYLDSLAIEHSPFPSNDNAHTTTEVVTSNVGHRTEALSSLDSEIVEPSNVGIKVSTDIRGIQNYGGPPRQTLTSEEIDAIQRTSMDFHDNDELSTEITPGGLSAADIEALNKM